LIEVHRILKPKKRFVFTTSFISPQMPANELYANYSSEAISQLLKKSGFKEISIIPTTGFFGALSALIYRRISYFNRKKWVLLPFLLIVWFLFILDIKKNAMFSTNFVIIAEKI